MDSREALLKRLTYILTLRVVSLIPPEFWRIPVLKWQIEIEVSLLKLKELNLPEDEYQEAVKSAYHEGLIAWAEENPDSYTLEEFAGWVWYGWKLGVLPDDWGINLMTDAINKDYDQFTRNFEWLQRDGLIPQNLSVPEFAALLLDPPDMHITQIPPGHDFWYALGVKDAREWHAKDGLTRQIDWHKRLGNFGRVFLRLLANKESRLGASDKLRYVSEFNGIEPSIENNIEYLNDNDRLSFICELAGIEMDKLTDGDSSRILDILYVLDAGYDFASKQGVSMAAYYGDKANSEKTQRQRLFKKLRDMGDRVK